MVRTGELPAPARVDARSVAAFGPFAIVVGPGVAHEHRPGGFFWTDDQSTVFDHSGVVGKMSAVAVALGHERGQGPNASGGGVEMVDAKTVEAERACPAARLISLALS